MSASSGLRLWPGVSENSGESAALSRLVYVRADRRIRYDAMSSWAASQTFCT
ncbi:hypothetical protein [Streptomyces naphthomycinicus]|uniref:hypothetical protein n=1 Tax=Streptomyces naphthomycinicus TaxID=2872625 RepID=UPI001CEC31C6|nr:hypothetical protein [Streptomyces sp. TML10]